MMNNIAFEPLKDTDLQYACQLYEEAFPIEERRDTSEWLLQNKQNPLFNILCIKQNQTFQGILSYWTFESFHYIEHFAISPQQRGHGIGCAALELFMTTRTQYPIILEVEPDVMIPRIDVFYFITDIVFTSLNIPTYNHPIIKEAPLSH